VIPIQTTHLRPRSYFALLAMIPVVLYLYVALKMNREDQTLWIITGFISAIPLGIFFYNWKSRVLIDNDGITSKTPFNERAINWKDITRSYLKVRHTGKSSQRRWHFENITGKGPSFSTGLYSRRSLRTIAEALTTKCPNAEIEPKIRDMAEGRFPWYIF
jgi:hypothetical protein